MATGFMPRIIALLLLLVPGAAAATEVALIGQIGERAAVLAVDGGDPKVVKLGQTWNGITVLALQKNRATVYFEGRERVLQQSPHHRSAQVLPVPAVPDRQILVALVADDGGHFLADGVVNGRPVRFVVDTGATAVALPASYAKRLGIDYLGGSRIVARTAGGPVRVYRVSLDSVRVGAIDLRGVEAVVVEHGLDIPLLGMTFLNRVNMRREGSTLSLTPQF